MRSALMLSTPQIERAGFLRRLDARLDQAEILVEDRVLERDTQREDPVEPALDGRQLLLETAAFSLQLEPSQFLKLVECGGA